MHKDAEMASLLVCPWHSETSTALVGSAGQGSSGSVGGSLMGLLATARPWGSLIST